MDKKSVSIVIVSHGRKDLLLRCLRSCHEQEYTNLQFVVLLNPSDPDTEAAILASFRDVKVIRTHRNIGFFPGLNLCIANSDGDFIMTVDDDAYFMSNLVIAKLVEAFEAEPELGVASCNLHGPRENTLSGNDRYAKTFKTGFTLIPKEAFTDWVGYYPDMFFRSAGETFLATGLWNQGRRVKVIVGAEMYHDQSLQGRSDYDWKFYGMRSQNLCAVIREPWIVLPASLLSKFIRSFINFIRWRHFRTWFKTWGSTAVHVPAALSLRAPVSWSTYKLLRRLERTTIEDPADLVQRSAGK